MQFSPRPSRLAFGAGLLALLALAVGYAFLVGTAYRNASIHQWDESRQAMNALMMAENGNWLVTYFHDEPDMWNTKPPLLIWLMVLCLKIFGYTDWAVRLPVGIAGCLTVLLVAGWCWRESRSPSAGVAAGLVLLSSYGFMGMHGATTADYDVALTLLVTGAAVSFHRWVETGDRRMLPLTGAGFALAVLVKSIAGLMVLPGFALYALVRKRLPALLRETRTWISVLGALAIVAAYYLAREQVNPGYLAAVVKNEWTGRYLEVIEKHDHGPLFYLAGMWGEPKALPGMWPGSGRYMPWMFVVPLLWAFALAGRAPSVRSLALFATCCTLPYLAVISSARTKLYWYDIPLYPMLAVLAGIGIVEVARRAADLASRLHVPRVVGSVLVSGVFLLVSGYSVKVTYLRLRNLRSQNESVERYVERLRSELPELHFTSFHRDGNAPYHFYVLAGSLEAQRRRGVTEPSLESSTFVICDPERLERARRAHRTEVVHGGEAGNPCVTLTLLGPPEAEAGLSP